MEDISIIDIAKLCGAIGSILAVYWKLRGEIEKMIEAKLKVEKSASKNEDEKITIRVDGMEKEIDRFIDKHIALEGELKDHPHGLYSIIQGHSTKIPDLENRISRLE